MAKKKDEKGEEEKKKGRLSRVLVVLIVVLIVLYIIASSGDSNDPNEPESEILIDPEFIAEEETDVETEPMTEDKDTTAESETLIETETKEEEKDTEQLDEGNESSYEWDAGSLAYLDMSREEILAVYMAYDEYIIEESWDMSKEEIDTYENESAEQVALEYGVTADDVNQIYICGGKSNYFATFNVEEVEVPYGDVESVVVTGSEVTIKVKISPSLTNKMTIEQNYYNACDFIRDYAKTDYDKITYWSVADTTDGNETKVISFDVSGSLAATIATQDFPDNTLGDYVNNLYILPSLQEDN